MASPAALARTLSLQRANARAKSSRAESFPDQKSGSQLSKRIDILFTSISSGNNYVTDRCNIIDTQSNKPVCHDSSKQLALQGDDDNSNALKRSFSADIPSVYKACFSSLSERIDKGLDLWDRDFSSMSSYASDHDSFLYCGLQRRQNSGSNILCAPKGKEDASSWSEDSLVDALQMEDEASCSNALQGDCTSGSHSHIANENLQGDARSSLQAHEKHKLLPEKCSADYEVAKGRNAGVLDEYLSTRGAYCMGHSLQSDECARDVDEETKSSMNEGHSTKEEVVGNVNRRSKYTSSIDTRSSSREDDNGNISWKSDGIVDGSSSREDDEKGEGMISSKKDDDDDDSYRMRVRSKRDYDKLKEEILGNDNEEEDEPLRLPPDSEAVEVVSLNVVEDFRESMYEMMMEKDMEEECEDNNMQDLLNCYLLLNPSQLHGIIREVFTDVWIDIIMTIR